MAHLLALQALQQCRLLACTHTAEVRAVRMKQQVAELQPGLTQMNKSQPLPL